MAFKAEVRVELKKGILDAEAIVTKKSLELLGFRNISDVKTAKIFSIDLSAASKEDAEAEADEMCKKLLANPVINNYKIVVK